jgi:hypothetical protein
VGFLAAMSQHHRCFMLAAGLRYYLFLRRNAWGSGACARCVEQQQQHGDSGSRAWGSGACARCVEQQQQQQQEHTFRVASFQSFFLKDHPRTWRIKSYRYFACGSQVVKYAELHATLKRYI